jgi:hypothetical protein
MIIKAQNRHFYLTSVISHFAQNDGFAIILTFAAK